MVCTVSTSPVAASTFAAKVVWNAVYGEAVQELKDAMDLAYLTGQRPADV
ncbi:hypothetical protein [Pseudomonas fluorescens]